MGGGWGGMGGYSRRGRERGVRGYGRRSMGEGGGGVVEIVRCRETG